MKRIYPEKRTDALKKKGRRYITLKRKNPERTASGKIRLASYKSMGHLIFFPLIFVYFEILLRVFTGTGVFQHIAYPLLFGLAAGTLCTCLTIVFPDKINRLVGILLILATTILFITECLVRNTFQVYMTFHTIRAGAGGVVNGYRDTLIQVILHSLLIIGLYLVPLVFYLIFGNKVVHAWQYKISFAAQILALSLVLILVSVLAAVNGKSRQAYLEQYEFSSAIETFGLFAGLELDFFKHYKPSTLTLLSEEPGEADAENKAGKKSLEMEAEEEPLRVAPEGKNELDVDFDQLLASAEDEDTISLTQYFQSQKATDKNIYTGLFEGKNLILICAEAFSDVALTEELTPTLYRLSQNGITFHDYYQPSWGGSTVTGEYSFLIGLVPVNAVESMTDTIGKDLGFTMGHQLMDQGYFSRAFHNGDYDFYNRNLTHENLGYEQFVSCGNGLEEICGYYPLDADCMDATLDLYLDQQPFSIYYMTLSGHCTYDEEDERVYNNIDLVKEKFGDGYADKTYYYLCYQYELEKAVKLLVDRLEEAGIADDTVICLTADHYPYGLAESATFGNDRDYVSDLYGYPVNNNFDQDHNSLIIWSGCLEHEDSDLACDVEDPVYSLDILPTLSNLFGLDFDSRLMIGRDVFSGAEPLVLWNDYSWITREGRYNSSTGEFTPSTEGATVEESYIERIKTIVANKISVSPKIIEENYFAFFMSGVKNKASLEAVPADDIAVGDPDALEESEVMEDSAQVTERAPMVDMDPADPEEENGKNSNVVDFIAD